LRELGLPATMLSPVLAHAQAVEAEADRLGLVSKADTHTILARHTADSLLFALARMPQAEESWADIGSGAGFPGFVLAICYPASTFTLVEPQQRRAGFLEMQRARLGLDNVEIVVARAETLSTETFDVVVSRALAEPALALEAMHRIQRRGGAVLLAVGSDAVAPPGVEDLDLTRPGVDSPCRLLMMAETPGGA
jgi:16S rRNA (guanine(527)-N(7))-methyltransferase RsmG